MTTATRRRPRQDSKTLDARRRTNSRLTALTVVLVAGLGLAYVYLGQPGLPPYFRFDAEKIHYLVLYPHSLLGDRTFDAIAGVYAYAGLSNPSTAGVLTYSVYTAVVLLVYARHRTPDISVGSLLYIVVCLALGAVYLGQYSKDIVPALLVPMISGNAPSRRRTLLAFAATVAYAYFFRQYWFAVAGLSLFLNVAMRRKRPILMLIGGAVAAWLVLQIAVQSAGYSGLTDVRTLTNDTRTLDAASQIDATPIGPGTLGEVVGTSVVWFNLFIPIKLAAVGTPYHLAVASVIAAIWLCSLKLLLRPNPRCAALVSLLFALTIVQAVFEPDYGSYLRHLTPLLPALLAIHLVGRRATNAGHDGTTPGRTT